MRNLSLLAAAGLAFATAGAFAGGDLDFGKIRDRELEALAPTLFGVFGPLHESSTKSIDKTMADANPAALATVAKSLKVRVVTSGVAAPNIDMIALWPDDQAPTHLIFCNEEGPAQAGVQRLRLADGKVETILTGTNSCDPVRRTAWGTILVGEESGNTGQVLEIINPINTTGVLFDRVAGTFSGGTGAGNIATRYALGRLSFEGMALYPNGVMYYGDENRPATGTAGGAYFKFVPATPHTGSAPISNLADSPLVAGKVYGLRLGKRSGNTDYGQGSNTGLGTWIEVVNANNADLRAAAAALKLTGYYRPEDIDIDRRALADGKVRFCGNNTGNEGDDHNWGESICITDGTLVEATANTADTRGPALRGGHTRAGHDGQHGLPPQARFLDPARRRRFTHHARTQ